MKLTDTHNNMFIIVQGYGDFTMGGGPRVVVCTSAFLARAQGSFAGLGGLKETKKFFPIHS